MAKLLRLFKKRQNKEAKTEPRVDVYELFCEDNWDKILSSYVEGEDILEACETLLRKEDFEGAIKLVSIVSSVSCFPYCHSEALHTAWITTLTAVSTDLDHVMLILAHAEKDTRFNGEKRLLNCLIETALNVILPSAEKPLWKQLVDRGWLEGQYSFAFDLALSARHYEDAFSILVAMEEKSVDHVVMLQDISVQMACSVAVPFTDYCLQKGYTEFAFCLAVRLKQWTTVEKQIGSGVKNPALLRLALRHAVVDKQMEIVTLTFDQLSALEILDELLHVFTSFDVSAVVDLLLEGNYISEAIHLACSLGMSTRAAQIITAKGFLMSPELSIFCANACFDNHCGPDAFLGKGWDRDLLQHILDAPRLRLFSENQWWVVTNFISDITPREALLALMNRAVDEDAACMERFIGQGINDDMMEYLLSNDITTELTDNQLNVVVKLLLREAEMTSSGNTDSAEPEMTSDDTDSRKQEVNSSDEMDTRKPEMTSSCRTNLSTDEPLSLKQNSELDSGVFKETSDNDVIQYKSLENTGHGTAIEHTSNTITEKNQVCQQPDTDWSTCVPVIDSSSPPPWWYVMRAAQRARHSKHLRQLINRAFYDGHWNCFTCLAADGLGQHPLDLLLDILHSHPHCLVLSYIQQHEQKAPCYFHRGWKHLNHDLYFMTPAFEDLMEERHRMIFVEKALAYEDCNDLRIMSFLDLGLPERRALFRKAMEKRQWSLAMHEFDHLPDKVDVKVFQGALRQLSPSSEELLTSMIERGFYNRYLTPDFCCGFPHQDPQAQSKKKPGKEVKKLKDRLRKKDTPAPNNKLPMYIRTANPPVTEGQKDDVTSTQGDTVLRSARFGDWCSVMNLYEGGMGEAVKIAVLREAMAQEKWHVITTLVRRDPESDIFYRQYSRELIEKAADNIAWSTVEAVVEKLSSQEDREWLFPFALGLRRWSLLQSLVKKGVSTELQCEAMWEALRRNEWIFIMDFVLGMEKPTEILDQPLQTAIVKAMSRLLTTVQPPASPDASFGLRVIPLSENGDKAQGQDQETDDVTRAGNTKDGGEEEEEGEATQDSAVQVAARLQLWKVCKVLLLCGARPYPCNSSRHEDVILLALRHNRFDVIHMLLDLSAVTDRQKNRVVRELLLTRYLKLDAGGGMALLCRLQEEKEDGKFQTDISMTHSSTNSNSMTTFSDDVKRNDVSVKELLQEQVRKALAETDSSIFQPCVANAVESGEIKLPDSLTHESLYPDEYRPSEQRHDVSYRSNLLPPFHTVLAVPHPDPYDDASEVGPRVPLRVDRERLAPPTTLPPPPCLSSLSPPPPPPPFCSERSGSEKTEINIALLGCAF